MKSATRPGWFHTSLTTRRLGWEGEEKSWESEACPSAEEVDALLTLCSMLLMEEQ